MIGDYEIKYFVGSDDSDSITLECRSEFVEYESGLETNFYLSVIARMQYLIREEKALIYAIVAHPYTKEQKEALYKDIL